MREFLYSAIYIGVRGRAIHGIFLLGFCLLGFSYLAAGFSPRQPQAVALDVGLSFLRFSLVLLAIFWVQELVGKEFERKTVLVAFAYPVPRSSYLVGRYFGVVGLLLIAGLILGLFLWWVVLVSDHGYAQGRAVDLGWPFALAVLGVVIDAAVVAAFTLCIASLSTVTLLPLVLGGLFAIISRALGPILDYLRHGADGDRQMAENFGPILGLAQWGLPDLSRLDWRVGPLYQMNVPWDTLAWSVAMALSYVGLMLALAVFSCRRRELL